MEWTEENVLRLIESYRKAEILWESQHAKYYHKVKKSDAWNAVAEDVGTTTDDCKKKMSALLSALRREKAKIKKSHGTGMGRSDMYESSWFALNSLRFLWDKNKVRETRSTIEETEECSDAEKDILTDPSQEDETVRSPLPTQSTSNEELVAPSRQQCPTRKRKSRVDEKLDAAFKILSNASRAKEPTECDIFGNLVAQKLNKYSQMAQTAVQEAIMGILFRADRGYFDQPTAEAPFPFQNHSTPTAPYMYQYSLPHQSTLTSPTPSSYSLTSEYSTGGPQNTHSTIQHGPCNIFPSTSATGSLDMPNMDQDDNTKP